MSDQLYRENIVHHYKHPQNYGRLDSPTHYALAHNPLCGDSIHLELIIKNNKVKEVAFIGQGCAISMAAMSLLSEKIKGMSVFDLKKLNEQNVHQLLGIEPSPARQKCAKLSVQALSRAIKKAPVS